MADRSAYSPLSDQSSPTSSLATSCTKNLRKIIVWNTSAVSPSMAVLVDEQVKELCHQALGRSKSSAASSILAHFPTIPEPTWAAGFLEALPVQYLLASLKELAVVVQHHPDIRQAVKEAGDLVRIEALKYIKLMPCENTDSDSPAGIMAMDCFLALGLHVPTFYPVAKGFLLDFQEEPQGALLILKGLNGEIFYLQFSFIMFRNVLNYFRHNRVQGLSP